MTTPRVSTVSVQFPSWKLRTAVTVVLLLVGFGAAYAYEQVQGPFEAKQALLQAENSDAAYAQGRFFATVDIPAVIRTVTVIGVLLVCWAPFVAGLARYQRAAAPIEPSRSRDQNG
jgi:hypothetical protein